MSKGDNAALLEMIEEDDLELHLSIINMTTKSKNNCHQDLYQLGQRFSVLFDGKRVSESKNPIGPTNIAGIFHASANVLDLDKERLLIFYVLFEKTVMASLSELYDKLNDQLVNAGIYPNIWTPKASALQAPEAPEKKRPNKQKGAPENHTGHMPEPVSPQDFELGGEVFQAIFSFLTERRRADARFREHIQYQPDGDPSLLKTKSAVVGAIDKVQHSIPLPTTVHEELESLGSGHDPLGFVKQRIDEEREALYQDLNENTIPTADLDTIDLVGMLFEEILNDESLANITKALICHLHTLYLKVAIVDRQFLANTDHIARQFLNLVVLSGREWIDESRLDFGVYLPLEKIIAALMKSYEQDVSIFAQYHEMLQEQVNQLEKRAKITENRSREVTKGKDRLEYARYHAGVVIEKNLEGEYIHPVLGDFLYHEWKDCITMMLLRNPKIESTKDWRSVLMVIHSLSKVSRRRGEQDDKGWLKNFMPILKKHIDHVLNYLGDDHRTHTAELFELLESWSCGRFDKKSLTKKSHFLKADAGETQIPKLDQAKLTSEEKSILQILKQAEFGTWFEFAGEDEDKKRVKLSWYSPITHKHMFTDRFGAKAYIVPTDVLIQKIKDGTAKIIDMKDLPFVDKALLKIHSVLKSS